MNIAIIGAGFTGLSAAYQLSKNGHTVSIFEKDPYPGGLAVSFKKKKWDWSLEHHYHHWFSNDDSVLSLASELDCPVIIKRPKTSVYVEDKLYQLDSPYHLLTFPKLPLVDRLRIAGTLASLRFNPFWKHLENYRAEKYLQSLMGHDAYTMLWKPQLHNKFGSYASDISLSWFWARIKKRTPNLAYPKRGYLFFAERIVDYVQGNYGRVLFNTEVISISSDSAKSSVTYKTKNKKKKEIFDAVIVTLPSFIFLKIVKGLPLSYKRKLQSFKGLGAINMVLRLKKPFFADSTYWLSICDTKSPIMALVEHTNFMDKKHYNGEHLVYVGNYLSLKDALYRKSPDEVLEMYDPFLKTIQRSYRKNLIGYDLFKVPFAQPIIPIQYSKDILPITTPLPHIYLANMQQVYPWDRGTNYAVELGVKAAGVIAQS